MNFEIKKIIKKYHYILKKVYSVYNLQKLADFLYYETFHKYINWENPSNLNEIINVLSFSEDTSIWSRLTDKYLVRDYVKTLLPSDVIIPLYGVYKSVEEIDYDNLPKSFVLKCNNGCGDTIVIHDKNNIDKRHINNIINENLHRKFGRMTAEPHYLKINPLIIAEKILQPSVGEIVDYKIFCLSGEPFCILTCSNRNIKQHTVNLNLFSLNWENLNRYLSPDYRNEDIIPQPSKLADMIEYARKLSKPFKVVRVDFYEIDGHVYFGEITFTSAAGRMTYFTDEFLTLMAQKVKL